MAVKKEVLEIDALAKMKNLDAAVLAGVKASKDWQSGKMISEKEFDSAVKAFLSAPLKKVVK